MRSHVRPRPVVGSPFYRVHTVSRTPCCAMPSGAASMWSWYGQWTGSGAAPDLVGTMQELHGAKVDPFVYVLPRLPVGDQSSRRPPSTRAPSSVRPCSLRRLIRRLLPSGNDAHALASLGVVGDEREVPAELDDGRQLAAFVIRAADRGGGGIVDDEHAAS